MKIVTFWGGSRGDGAERSLHWRNGQVVCLHPDGRYTPTGWRSVEDVRSGFGPSNPNIIYVWASTCPRRTT